MSEATPCGERSEHSWLGEAPNAPSWIGTPSAITSRKVYKSSVTTLFSWTGTPPEGLGPVHHSTCVLRPVAREANAQGPPESMAVFIITRPPLPPPQDHNLGGRESFAGERRPQGGASPSDRFALSESTKTAS